jgi:hypothetical protein
MEANVAHLFFDKLNDSFTLVAVNPPRLPPATNSLAPRVPVQVSFRALGSIFSDVHELLDALYASLSPVSPEAVYPSAATIMVDVGVLSNPLTALICLPGEGPPQSTCR